MESTKETLSITYESYLDSTDLAFPDQELLANARNAVHDAYAPYSQFCVGAAAILSNGQIITGSNQENASFPAGLCAERVLLSAISSIAPNEIIKSMAISYKSDLNENDRPIAPCGVCRQAMMEYQSRSGHPIRIILAGQKGRVIVFQSVSDILPLSFTPKDLGKH